MNISFKLLVFAVVLISCFQRTAQATAPEPIINEPVTVQDTAIFEVVPLNEKAWHVRYNVETDNKIYGYDANDTAIGVELCYSTKGNIDNLQAYTNYCEYIAYLCLKFNLDPYTP